MKNIASAFSFLLAVNFAHAGVSPLCGTAQPHSRVDAVVVRGVDGDTVKVRTTAEFNVRMLSIDTPETHFEGQSQGFWGDQAAANLALLLPPGTPVQLELDTQVCDRYGRVLAYVWKGNQNINLQQLEEGMAVSYCIAPNISHCEEFAPPVARAISDRRGMFSDPSVMLPYDWRRMISNRAEDQYVGSLTTRAVYRPGNKDRVAVADRIFFYLPTDIQAPYYLAD